MVSCALGRVCCLLAAALLAAASSSDAQTPDSGRRQYEKLCSRCHGGDGRGGEFGPAISTRLGPYSDRELAALIRQGLPGKGMPGVAVPDTEMRRLVAFVRTLRSSEPHSPVRITVETTDGQALEGHALNQTSADMQLATATTAGSTFSARTGPAYRPVTSQVDWPTYHGTDRRQPLQHRSTRSHKGTSPALAPHWMFSLPSHPPAGERPSSSAGSCTSPPPTNAMRSMRAAAGRSGSSSGRARKGLAGDAAGGINRGVAVAGDRVFMVTDHAHLIALDRFTGELLWDTEMADWQARLRGHRPRRWWSAIWCSPARPAATKACAASWPRSTSRPARRCGASGPCRSPASPASETWQGTDIEHGCAPRG